MYLLIHGDNISASRAELTRLKTDYKLNNQEVLEISDDQLKDFEQGNLGTSLFGNLGLIVVENYWTKPKKSAPILGETDVIFYESHKLASLPKIAKLETKRFDLEQFVFKFLDGLAPGAQERFMPFYLKYREQEVPEIIFTMLVRQNRLLILVTAANSPDSSDLKVLQGWQINKLKIQANKFTRERLENVYLRLLEIDFQIKNSPSGLDLITHLDLLLASL